MVSSEGVGYIGRCMQVCYIGSHEALVTYLANSVLVHMVHMRALEINRCS